MGSGAGQKRREMVTAAAILESARRRAAQWGDLVCVALHQYVGRQSKVHVVWHADRTFDPSATYNVAEYSGVALTVVQPAPLTLAAVQQTAEPQAAA